MDTDETEIMGEVLGSVANSSSKTSENTMKKYIFGKMAELFEERLCELVWNYRHIYDSPHTRTDNSNRTAGKTLDRN